MTKSGPYTQKHFEMVARVLEAENDTYNNPGSADVVKRIVVRFADEFASNSFGFDRGRFFAACGFTEGPDFTVADEGTIFLLQPLTPAANEWVKNFLPEDAQTFGSAVAIEHRYIHDIVEGIKRDGLEVR